MREPIWIEKATVLAIHDEQIAEHGGAAGVRDQGLLESALARPRHLSSYGDPDIIELAAAYAFGVTRNHPFVDGNKRTAYVVMELFLLLNGVQLVASDVDCVATMLRLASSEIGERKLVSWLRANSAPL